MFEIIFSQSLLKMMFRYCESFILGCTVLKIVVFIDFSNQIAEILRISIMLLLSIYAGKFLSLFFENYCDRFSNPASEKDKIDGANVYTHVLHTSKSSFILYFALFYSLKLQETPKKISVI